MAWLGLPMLYLGLALTVTGMIGLWRMPDVYLRYKSTAIIGGLSAVLVHAATALLVPLEHGARGFLTALLFLLSVPVISQAILLAAWELREESRNEVDDLTRAREEGREPPTLD